MLVYVILYELFSGAGTGGELQQVLHLPLEMTGGGKLLGRM